MKHWHVSQRNKALVLATLAYALIKAGLPRDVAGNWLPTLLPMLQESAATSGVRLAQSALEGLGLATLVLLIEVAVLLWTARWLIGHWVYQSSSSNWGHAVLSIDPTQGALRYNVDLFRTREDLLRSLETGELRGFIGHGSDRITLHEATVTKIWYHVPEHRTDDICYPQREGILTLVPANQPGVLVANWSRLGGIGPTPAAGTEAATGADIAAINAQDRSHASGSFKFFTRKRRFLASVRNERRGAA